jgi:flagellar FliJ protein
MKKFKFRLDSVLDYREQVEKERQVALTKVHRLVVEHEQKLLEAYAVLERAREDLRAQERGGEIDVAQARQHRLHIGSLRKQVSEVLKRLRKLEVELASRREEAVQARKERKVLEMLKAKRRAEYVKEADRFEQAELDDIAQKQEVLKRTGT